MALSNEKLSTLRALLPHGSGKKIAVKLKITQPTVSRVLNGKSSYPGVIEEAWRIVGRIKSSEKRVAKKLETVA